MKRAIITGATGAVGTALIKELLSNQVEILVFCRENSSRNSNIPDSPLITKRYIDLNHLATIENDTDKEYDVFYHLAWAGTTGLSRNDMYQQVQNINYALDAVGAAKKFGCKCFVGIGSQAEYGRFEGVLRADTPTFPEMGYGYAKLCAGLMTRDYAHQIGLKHVWVRILSIYGPNDGNQSLVMSVINSLNKNIAPKCTKGEQMWDYLYSGDAAKALFVLGEKGIDGKVYVLGSGKVKPLSEYICTIQKIVNPECQIEFGAIPYSEKQVMHLQADITELCKDTEWSPCVEFEDGIKSIVRRGGNFND